MSYTREHPADYFASDRKLNGFEQEFPHSAFSLHPISAFKNQFLSGMGAKAGCVSGEYSCWVMPDMNVYPCIMSIPQHPAYNLKERSYHLMPVQVCVRP